MAKMTGSLTREYKKARDFTRKRKDRQDELKRAHDFALESAKAEDDIELQRRKNVSNMAQQREVSAGNLALTKERSRSAAALKGTASPMDLAQMPGLKAEGEAAGLVLNKEKRRLAEEQFIEDSEKRASALPASAEAMPEEKKATALSLASPLTTKTGKTKYVSGIAATLKTMLAEGSKKRREDFKKRFSLFPNNLQ